MWIGSLAPTSRVISHRMSNSSGPSGVVVVAPVAQEIVELLQAVFVVAAVALERDGDGVVAVGVLERERARLAVGDRVLQEPGTTNRPRRKAGAANSSNE